MIVIVEYTELENCKHIVEIRQFKIRLIGKIYGWYKKMKGYDVEYE